jgi:hypothetical protein
MTQATNQITSKFKDTFVKLHGGSTGEAEKAYFAMGFRWGFGNPRQVHDYSPAAYIRVDDEGTIWYASSTSPKAPSSAVVKGPQREVTLDELKAAAEEVKAIKREESKASKKRRAQRKWDATATKKTHNTIPVRKDVLVSVRFRNGNTETGRAGYFCWYDFGGFTIESYKVLTPNKHKPKPAVSEWIEWKGGKMPVVAGTLVEIRFSDGDELLATAADTYYWDWKQDGSGGDIVAYRIQPESEQMKTVTQEQMVVDLVQSMGKSIALEVGSLSALGTGPGVITTGTINTESTKPFGIDWTGNVQPDTNVAPDTNPKRQYGVSSVPLNMWSPLATAYGALGLYNGSLKYGKANFANTPVEASIYIAAAMRHLLAWACGQEDDPADGVPNLGGVLANIAILLEARAAGMLIDDRLRMAGYLKELDMLKAKVKALNELHAGKNPKHYTLDQK